MRTARTHRSRTHGIRTGLLLWLLPCTAAFAPGCSAGEDIAPVPSTEPGTGMDAPLTEELSLEVPQLGLTDPFPGGDVSARTPVPGVD